VFFELKYGFHNVGPHFLLQQLKAAQLASKAQFEEIRAARERELQVTPQRVVSARVALVVRCRVSTLQWNLAKSKSKGSNWRRGKQWRSERARTPAEGSQRSSLFYSCLALSQTRSPCLCSIDPNYFKTVFGTAQNPPGQSHSSNNSGKSGTLSETCARHEPC
jgi:hypothetical protein